MQNIHIKRFANDPTAQGCIEPEDRSWQLVIDAKGIPHLWVSAKVTDEGDTGGVSHGYIALDDFLPEDTTVEDIMNSEFCGRCTPDEETQFAAEFAADEAAGKRPPCPR